MRYSSKTILLIGNVNLVLTECQPGNWPKCTDCYSTVYEIDQALGVLKSLTRHPDNSYKKHNALNEVRRLKKIRAAIYEAEEYKKGWNETESQYVHEKVLREDTLSVLSCLLLVLYNLAGGQPLGKGIPDSQLLLLSPFMKINTSEVTDTAEPRSGIQFGDASNGKNGEDHLDRARRLLECHTLTSANIRHLDAWIYKKENGLTVDELATHLHRAKRTAEYYLTNAKLLIG